MKTLRISIIPLTPLPVIWATKAVATLGPRGHLVVPGLDEGNVAVVLSDNLEGNNNAILLGGAVLLSPSSQFRLRTTTVRLMLEPIIGL